MKKYKCGITLMVMMTVLAGSIFGPAGTTVLNVYASDKPVVEETEPVDAVRGKIHIQTVRYEDYEYPIQLDFYPMFEGGVHRVFILGKENGFQLNEELIVGDYHIAAGIYSAEGLMDDDVIASVTPEITIEENGDIPIVVAMEGPKSFVRQYDWLTIYKDDTDGYLSGVINKEEAEAYFENSITSQKYTPLDEQEMPSTEEAVEFEAEEKEKKADSFISYLKYIIPAILVVGVVSVILALLKKRKK